MIETLYVDDDPILLELAKEFLEGENEDLNVTICNSAKDVLPLLNKKHFDVIISDYQMPSMNGLDLLKELRSKGIDVPFILFTGKGGEEVAIEALNNGADFYLNKGGNPRVQFTELMNLVRHMVMKREAIEAVKHNAERFRAMIENSLDVFGIINPEGTVRYISPSVKKILGYGPESIIGSPITNLFHPEENEKLQQQMDAGRKGTSDLLEYKVRRSDGEIAYFEGSFSKIRDDIGKGFLVFNGKEITKRKKVEELLRESEERYHVMFNSSPVGILLIKGVVKECNTTAAELLGFDSSELIGKSFIELWSERQEGGLTAEEAIRGLAEIQTGSTRRFRWTARLRTGRSKNFEASLKNVKFQGERHFLLSFIEAEGALTERRPASLSEEACRTLLMTARDPIFVIDSNFRVTLSSPGADMRFGQGGNIVGKSLLDLVDGPDKEILTRDLGEIIKGEKAKTNRYRFLVKDGSKFYSELTANVIEGDGGEAIGLVCIFHDVTQQVLAEGQAINANKYLSEMTELMRIEIEKRMTVLMAHLQLLQFRYQDDMDREEVEMAISDAEEVLKALAIAKSYEIMDAEPHQWMPLADVIDAALEGSGATRLKVSIDIDGYSVFGSAKIGNALERLLEQCLRQDREATFLAVRTNEDHGRLVIVIEDDGAPYDERDLERLFDTDSGGAYIRTLRFSRDILRSSGFDVSVEGTKRGLRFRLSVPPGRFKKNL
ncbi:MAG: PAS domain S-box protein [Methanomassiliicoccales archaeon]|nr:MAG: PAS domain S-box protein [Methanomassiliicoccales archaeon]